MNRGKGFRTGREALDRARARKARPVPVVPKALGESLVDKGPWRSDAHKARVVACGCLVLKRSKAPTDCWGPIDPHHVTKWRGGGGKQPSDALVVPLCRTHHDEAQGHDERFEEKYGLDFARWIERFSAPGALEIAKVRGGENATP